MARGVMPRVKELLARGSVTQTWLCFPMETGTNWACLATGASPWVHGCNMHMHLPGDPLDKWQTGFPSHLLTAESLWTTAHRAGKRSIIFDWGQSWPLTFTDGMIHVGGDGNPTWPQRALQGAVGYSTDVTPQSWFEQQLWRRVTVQPNGDVELPVVPNYLSRYRQVSSLYGKVRGGHLEIHGARDSVKPLLPLRVGEMSGWARHTFTADGQPVPAFVRGKLLKLSSDGRHLHLSQLHHATDFVHPAELAEELVTQCGPYVGQPGPQQLVTFGAEDVPTFVEEQESFSRWTRLATAHLLQTQPWDLYMLKWHTPDWAQHLSFYMIDDRHPLHDPARAAEGWAYWDRLMSWGDEIVGAVLDAAGPDTLVALVSDHGGAVALPGLPDKTNLNHLLEQHAWLARGAEGVVDWARTVAYGHGPYVFLNLQGRDSQGIVSPGEEFTRLRDEIIEALLDWKDSRGRHRYRVVLPREDAGRLAVGGDRVGDIFLIAAPAHPLAKVDRAEFWRTHSVADVGTWDWPLINAGGHSDDSYFVLAGRRAAGLPAGAADTDHERRAHRGGGVRRARAARRRRQSVVGFSGGTLTENQRLRRCWGWPLGAMDAVCQRVARICSPLTPCRC